MDELIRLGIVAGLGITTGLLATCIVVVALKVTGRL
jgi:hypothetical protein